MQTVFIKNPMGFISISGTAQSVCRVEFVRQVGRVQMVQKEKTPKFLKGCARQLEEYFAGCRKIFTVPLLVVGTPFQKKVWRELQKIPYGQMVSYGEIARRMGKPKAARAVGGACNKNKIPIIIPCHRVVGDNGSLVGFAGGLKYKKQLLNLERSRV